MQEASASREAQLREQELRKLERDTVTVYNCDPTSKRGGPYGFERFDLEPLGVSGDHAVWPRYIFTALSAINMLVYNREDGLGKLYVGWLTTEKPVYEKALKELRELEVVTNPKTPTVKALKNRRGKWEIRGLTADQTAELSKAEEDDTKELVMEAHRKARERAKGAAPKTPEAPEKPKQDGGKGEPARL
jgi:hypothetical protein